MQSKETREIFPTDSDSFRNPPTEGSPLLSSRYGSTSLQSGSMSSASFLERHRYHFNLQREKLRCKKMFYNRVPKGKAAFVVFLVNFLESMAFHGALDLIHFTLFRGGFSPKSDFIFSILNNTIGRMFYPFAGLIADVYVGRYRVIHGGLWLLFSGFVTILIGMAFQWHSDSIYVKIPAIVATVFFMLGSASVESTIIPFGVDQIWQGASSEEISSYFSWYYFGRNLGYIAGILGLFAIRHSVSAVNEGLGWTELNKNTSTTTITLMEGTISMSLLGIFMLVGLIIALSLHYCFQHWFFKARHRENPVRSICNILYFAATVKRQGPRYRRAFRYGEERKSRIELAKMEFDGIFSSEEVEDVKTFFRVLLMMLSLSGAFATYGALSGMYTFVTARCSSIGGSYNSLINSSVVIFFIPLLNNLFLPCVPGVSIKKRIGVGVVFFFLSTLVATVINLTIGDINSHSMLRFWLTIPVMLLALGDALVFISGLEFIYAQSPDSMKGLTTGLFYFIFGAFNAVGTGLFRIVTHNMDSPTCTSTQIKPWFYYAALAICGVGCILYVLTAICYKNRQRPTNDESEKEILRRSIATSVYLSHKPA